MNVFPSFIGISWPVVKRPITNTVIHQSVSGREYRTALYQYPIYEFDLEFEYLSQSDVETMAGFYLQQLGPLNPFYFDNQNDDTVSNFNFATGNGTQTVFTLTKPNGDFFAEPIGGVNTIESVTGYSMPSGTWAADTVENLGTTITDSNGNIQQVTTQGTTGATEPTWATTVGATTSDNTVVWTMVAPYTTNGNQITFAVAPASGSQLYWTGTYYYLVRFKDDKMELSQFLDQFYENRQLSLRTFF